MKKSIIALLFAAAMMVAAPSAMACYGYGCFSTASLNLKVKAADGAIDMGGTSTYNGMTGGVVAAGGMAEGRADGFVFNGETRADLGVVAGGRVDGGSYDYFMFNRNEVTHVLGSYSQSDAEVGGHIFVNNSGRGMTAGAFRGVAGQGGAVVSAMGSAPIQENDFLTGGIAAQGSVGFIEGSAFSSCYRGKGAGAEGNIYMAGYTETASFRGVYDDGNIRQEYAGTNSTAGTVVDSYGDRYYEGRYYRTNAHIDGGFTAAGIAANGTVVDTKNGTGSATGIATYMGKGHLGCDFNGNANVSTMVTTTKVHGMQGSIISSNAAGSSSAIMNGGYGR